MSPQEQRRSWTLRSGMPPSGDAVRDSLHARILTDAPASADAVVWLQGNRYARGSRALELFRHGYAPIIMVTGNDVRPDEVSGSDGVHVKMRDLRDWLLERDVPASAIVVDDTAMHTRDQAVHVLAHARAHHWQSMLLVASPHHQLRAFLTFLRRAQEVGWSGRIINQPAMIPWDAIPSGRRATSAVCFQEEAAKLDRYGDHVATIAYAVERHDMSCGAMPRAEWTARRADVRYEMRSMPEPFIIAEVAQGYEGSEKLIFLFVKAAAVAGADAVKFQVLFADESALPDYQHYALFKRLEFPAEVWQRAVQQAHALGIQFYMDALGLRSMAMLEPFGIDGYKIHTGSITNRQILRAVARTRKPVLLSTGGNTPGDITAALGELRGCAVTLMHGFQAEPTPIEDNHIRRIRTLHERFQLPIGFQDHTAGDDAIAPYIPYLALGAGATLIEKHLTLSRRAEMEDYISAFTAEEFTSWVALVRRAAAALGNSAWTLTERELAYKAKAQKAIVTNRMIAAGDCIREEDVTFKRTHQTGALFDVGMVFGRRATHPIDVNIALTTQDLV